MPENQIVGDRKVILKAPGEPVLDGEVVPWTDLPSVGDVIFIGENVGDKGYRIEDIVWEDDKIIIVFDTTKYLLQPPGGKVVEEKKNQ